MKFYIEVFFEENISKKFKFHLNLTRIAETLHDDQYTFVIIHRSIILIMGNFSDKSCRDNKNIHFMFNNFFSKIVPVMRYGKIL
jgi:hypothetical protein